MERAPWCGLPDSAPFRCFVRFAGGAHTQPPRLSPTPFPHPRQGDSKRLLLAALTKSLATVLPFLEQALERNFAAAQAAAGAGASAGAHVSTIHAALQAVRTYADWAPVGRLKDAGLVGACGYLLTMPEFREAVRTGGPLPQQAHGRQNVLL